MKVQFDTNKFVFDLKPSHRKALELIGTYFTMDVLGVVQKGIKHSNEKRIRTAGKKLNKEVKETGSPFSTTVRKFEVFINRLLDKESQQQKIDRIEGVLFYAHNN